ncbi:MAG: DUF839 domain-containing protein [Chloroflexota bacterium]
MADRRAFLSRASLALAGAALTHAFGVAAQARAQAGPSSLEADPNGIIDLPTGYRYRILVRSGDTLADGTQFRPNPDLNALRVMPDGTSLLVVGHEIAADRQFNGQFTGGLTRLHLGAAGEVFASATLTQGTRTNCSGVLTPWGTVLTHEEFPREPYESYPDEGFVWEVDPLTGEQRRLDAMGRFSHESSAVDPSDGAVYTTADLPGGPFFRFQPRRPGDLSEGALFAYRAPDHAWLPISNPYHALSEALAAGATGYNRFEDLEWGADGKLYICETGNLRSNPADLFGRIQRFDPATGSMSVFLEGGTGSVISPDNIAMGPDNRLYVCEDKLDPMIQLTGDNRVVSIGPGGDARVFASVRGGREPSGVLFSPDRKTMYLNILEAEGMTLAITGF